MAYIVPVVISPTKDQDKLKTALSLAQKNLDRLKAVSPRPDPEPYTFTVTIATSTPDLSTVKALARAQDALERLQAIHQSISD